jgi:hypothetical protein
VVVVSVGDRKRRSTLKLNYLGKILSVYADDMLMYDSIEDLEQKIKEQEVIIDAANNICSKSFFGSTSGCQNSRGKAAFQCPVPYGTFAR